MTYTNLYCVCVLNRKLSKKIGILSIFKEVSSGNKEELLEYFRQKLTVDTNQIQSLNLFASQRYRPVLLNRWRQGKDF